MSGHTATGRKRREVPEWAREGRHVTVVTDKGNLKGVVVKELPSAIYVSHRDSSRDLGTFSLSSQDDQPEGTLAEQGHKGIYKNFTRNRIERVDGANGDAPISPEATKALGDLLPLIPNDRLAAVLEDLLKAIPRWDPFEFSIDTPVPVSPPLSTISTVEREIRRLSAQ